MTQKLKPCPFCGSKAVIYDHIHTGSECRYSVACADNGCYCSRLKNCTPMCKAEAISAWNRREK